MIPYEKVIPKAAAREEVTEGGNKKQSPRCLCEMIIYRHEKRNIINLVLHGEATRGRNSSSFLTDSLDE